MLKPRHWFILIAFAISSSAFAISAWQGEKWAIVALAIFNILLAVLHQANARILDSSLKNNEAVIEFWRRDLIYSSALSEDHAAVLRELAAHDPATASIYYARLRQRVLARHPEETLPPLSVDKN